LKKLRKKQGRRVIHRERDGCGRRSSFPNCVGFRYYTVECYTRKPFFSFCIIPVE
jgi:hypothetical protein